MKSTRDHRPTEETSREVPKAPDQDTKKISASQLAEVLARVDGAPKPSATEPSGHRAISGTRPAIRRLPAPSAPGAASSESVEAIDDIEEERTTLMVRAADEDASADEEPTALLVIEASEEVIVDTTFEAPRPVAAATAPPAQTMSPAQVAATNIGPLHRADAGMLVTSARPSSLPVAIAIAIAIMTVLVLAAAGVLVLRYWG